MVPPLFEHAALHVPLQHTPLAHWSSAVHARPTTLWGTQVPELPGFAQ
jgi:hypothetical protein